MKGWVTWATAAAFICFGLGEIVLSHLDPTVGTDATRGGEHLLTGLALIGIGRKLDRAAI